MPQISPREWLYELANRNALVKRYLDITNTQFDSDDGRPPPDVLTPAVLVGLVSILVEENAAKETTLQRYLENRPQPPIIIEGEWPTIERNVIQSSSNIRFRDFLRSLWRRLQRPWGA